MGTFRTVDYSLALEIWNMLSLEKCVAYQKIYDNVIAIAAIKSLLDEYLYETPLLFYVVFALAIARIL